MLHSLQIKTREVNLLVLFFNIELFLIEYSILDVSSKLSLISVFIKENII